MPEDEKQEEDVALNVRIPKTLDTKLRVKIAERYGGGHKGDIQKAVKSALELWTSGDLVTDAAETFKASSDGAVKRRSMRVLRISGEKGLAAIFRLSHDDSLPEADQKYAQENAKFLVEERENAEGTKSARERLKLERERTRARMGV